MFATTQKTKPVFRPPKARLIPARPPPQKSATRMIKACEPRKASRPTPEGLAQGLLGRKATVHVSKRDDYISNEEVYTTLFQGSVKGEVWEVTL